MKVRIKLFHLSQRLYHIPLSHYTYILQILPKSFFFLFKEILKQDQRFFSFLVLITDNRLPLFFIKMMSEYPKQKSARHLPFGMISHILTTMIFHNFISPYLVQAPVNGTITADFEKA